MLDHAVDTSLNEEPKSKFYSINLIYKAMNSLSNYPLNPSNYYVGNRSIAQFLQMFRRSIKHGEIAQLGIHSSVCFSSNPTQPIFNNLSIFWAYTSGFAQYDIQKKAKTLNYSTVNVELDQWWKCLQLDVKYREIRFYIT